MGFFVSAASSPIPKLQAKEELRRDLLPLIDLRQSFATSQQCLVAFLFVDTPAKESSTMTNDSKVVKGSARKPPAAGNGRKAGTVNKTTKLAKEAIAYAAEGLGGADRLIAWAKEDPLNERSFWTTIYTKLLPLQVNAEINGRIVHGILKVPPKNA